MADTKISAGTDAGTLSGTEKIPVGVSGKKTTTAQAIANLNPAAGPNGTVQASNGSGTFRVSSILDSLTVAGSATVTLLDAAAFDNAFPGVAVRGTDTTGGGLLVVEPATVGPGNIEQFSYGIYSNWIFTRGNGTRQSPTAVLNDDDLGELSWQGFIDPGNVVRAAGIVVTARSDFSGTPTSEMIATNASNLGWQIKADGTFNADVGITVAGSPIGGSAPPGTSALIASAIGVDLNTAADTAMTLSAFATGKFYIVDYAIATNADSSITTAHAGVWSGAAGTGQNFMAPNSGFSGTLVNPTDWALNFGLNTAIAGTNGGLVNSAPFVNVSVPQGSAATADFYVFGRVF